HDRTPALLRLGLRTVDRGLGRGTGRTLPHLLVLRDLLDPAGTRRLDLARTRLDLARTRLDLARTRLGIDRTRLRVALRLGAVGASALRLHDRTRTPAVVV